jgi:uncharacterized membrane protein
MDLAIFSQAGAAFLFRWLHILFGITWIGLLYYFNFVQTPFMAEAEAATKPGVIQKLVPRALWYFRWAAMMTFLTGWAILLMFKGGHIFMASSEGTKIVTGGLLGTLMFLNVWLIIWPNQKIVIQNSIDTSQGKPANPKAADAAARAGVASRTNTLFSIPMAFFMAASIHLPLRAGPAPKIGLYYLFFAMIAGVIEFNAIKGKMVKPLATVKAVIHWGLALTVVMYVLIAAMMA